ncbi:RES family NAD+ phosphorylase [Microbulbifer marinus]|uniref:RES domain-containing protein n=1 Tax=Microbulbifer marinus TaxID=658218 RepID=A0A1H3VUW6_9GAMM|nr:RES family NAD+ phosphorylase [Microbulbifer marinus]SDZ78577.1 RES domain-containing protein [Microbulbifer marinus]
MSADIARRIEAGKVRLLGRLYRIVESQEEVATRSLVDSLQKQQVLEDLLEENKPARLPGSEQLHYLLATPFRYPPLPWGSRFGSTAESGIFYGSKTIPTVLAEAAYYRLLFFHDMDPLPPKPVTSYHNIFSAKYCADPGIRLQAPSWEQEWPALTHPANYRYCQSLGRQLRELAIVGLEVPSSRALQAGKTQLPPGNSEGINVALFEPQALLKRPPTQEADVTAETSDGEVVFLVKSGDGTATQTFAREVFQVDGLLPRPA